MGFYIQGPAIGKVKYLKNNYGAKTFNKVPKSVSEVPENEAIIVVVNNGAFEAAGYVFDDGELQAFTLPEDQRPKIFLTMNKDKAERLSGYKK